jgi:hypothetical protein
MLNDSLSNCAKTSFQIEMENIHNKAIFDGLNEALDGMRPYGLRGPPLPWSKQGRTLTFRFGTKDCLDDLLNEAEIRVLSWARQQIGVISPSEPCSDMVKREIERVREERLTKVLIEEVNEADRLWLDFEMEETQIKVDLADMIMNDLCFETA